MQRNVKQRPRPPNKVVHLYTQADRARKLAVTSGSQLVAELWELHALSCERNAELRQRRQRKTSCDFAQETGTSVK
jgi:hypothetical protein